jgi:hypothetical protein
MQSAQSVLWSSCQKKDEQSHGLRNLSLPLSGQSIFSFALPHFHFKSWHGWRIPSQRFLILQVISQRHFTKQAAHEYLLILFLAQYHLFPDGAVFQHLVNIHFAPLGGAVLVERVDSANQFFPRCFIKYGFHSDDS